MAKELSLPYNLPLAQGRRNGFMPFLRALPQSEMQIASSSIWTWVTDSIFYKNSCYAKFASNVKFVSLSFGLQLFFVVNAFFLLDWLHNHRIEKE